MHKWLWGDGVTPCEGIKHRQRLCRAWPKLRSNPVCRNALKRLFDTPGVQECSKTSFRHNRCAGMQLNVFSTHPVCRNAVKRLFDTKCSPDFRCRDLFNVGDCWHDDIRVPCSHNHSCYAQSSEITDVKDDLGVCVFLRTGLQQRYISH